MQYCKITLLPVLYHSRIDSGEICITCLAIGSYQMIVGWLPLLLLHPICLHFKANSLVLGSQPLFQLIFCQKLPLEPIFWAQKYHLEVIFCQQPPYKAQGSNPALVTIVPALCLPQHDPADFTDTWF